ncbi:hypothetical protein V6N12_023262 [Hibiscus sabdariffa]|uniref:Uncharacterized protein n=1 Tax=Hibiscus sabdariffa TaxID=183260 RepID=A0ABR2FX68_9ROSI
MGCIQKRFQDFQITTGKLDYVKEPLPSYVLVAASLSRDAQIGHLLITQIAPFACDTESPNVDALRPPPPPSAVDDGGGAVPELPQTCC